MEGQEKWRCIQRGKENYRYDMEDEIEILWVPHKTN